MMVYFQTSRLLLSNGLSQILFLAIPIFILTSILGAVNEDSQVLWVMPLMFSMLFMEQSIAMINQNEVLRNVPGILSKVRLVATSQFILVVILCICFDSTRNIDVPLVMALWAIAAIAKIYCSTKYHLLFDGPKMIPYVFVMANKTNYMQSTELWLALVLLSTAVLIKFQFHSLGWNPRQVTLNAVSLEGANKERTTPAFLPYRINIKNAFNLGLYMPEFLPISMVFFIAIPLLLINLFSASDSYFNAFLLALLGPYICALFSAVLIRDRQSRIDWYNLRPGLGSKKQTLLRMISKSSMRILAAAMLALTLAFSTDLALNHPWSLTKLIEGLRLALAISMLSALVLSWFSSFVMQGLVPVSVLILVGVCSGIVIFISILGFADAKQPAAFLYIYTLVLAVPLVIDTLRRYKKRGWQ